LKKQAIAEPANRKPDNFKRDFCHFNMQISPSNPKIQTKQNANRNHASDTNCINQNWHTKNSTDYFMLKICHFNMGNRNFNIQIRAVSHQNQIETQIKSKTATATSLQKKIFYWHTMNFFVFFDKSRQTFKE